MARQNKDTIASMSNSSSSRRQRNGGDEVGRHQRVASEDYSMNSSSTDSTRPTVHTNKRATVSMSQSRSMDDHSGTIIGGPASPNTVSSSFSHQNKRGGGKIPHGGSGSNGGVRPSSSNNKNHGKSKPRKRVPGGAAAKLMFRGPQKSASTEESYSNYDLESTDDGPVDTSDIYDMISRTKVEFETGKRMSPLTTMIVDGHEEEIEVSFSNIGVGSKDHDDVPANVKGGGGNVPYILNREEAYHENASAAVAAILNPQRGDNASMTSGMTGMTGMTEMYSTHSGSRHNMNASSVSAFQSPKYGDAGSEGSGGGASPLGADGCFDINQFDINQQQGGGLYRSPTTEPLISGATEAKLDRMSARMLDPSKTLSDLLRAIASPDDITTMDRAYMVRRKNACGALKVLTVHNRRRKQICWTVGVLPALTSVLQDAGEEPLELVYPDVRTRMEYEEARRRAIAALTNLAMPVSNRLAVFHTPGLVQALISTIMRVDGECLEGACAVLAYLAKSNENKILMAQVPGLFEAVIWVLKPKMRNQQVGPESPKEEYPWSNSFSDSESSVSSGEGDEEDDFEVEDEASILSGSTDCSSDGESSGEEDDDMDHSTDDDMSTDRESISGSEASSGSSDCDTSGDESGSEYRPQARKRKAAKGHHKKSGNSSKPVSPTSNSTRTKMHSDYDKDKMVSASRKNLFAMLGHLVKEKDNAYRLARANDLVPVVVEISKMHDSPIHVLAVQLLAHLTRHRLNSKSLVFKMQEVIHAMVKATYSTSEISRRYACFAIQNFSHDKSCRQELASSEKLITALCKRARHSKDPDERLAAICALKNLTDEPANLIPLSNTAECIATLMQIAHGQEEGVTEMMQFRACDALATISHWLRKIATNGQSMDAVKHGDAKPSNMFVPSLKVVGWEQYQ